MTNAEIKRTCGRFAVATVAAVVALVACASCGKFGEAVEDAGAAAPDAAAPDAAAPDVDGGALCTALRFDGQRGHVVIPDAPALDLTGSFTVEAWIKPRASALGRELHILSHHIHDKSQGWALLLKDGKLELRVYGRSANQNALDTAGESATRPTIPADDQWHHVAGTSDGALLRVFVDGQLVDTEALQPALTRAPYRGDLRIGRSAEPVDPANDFAFEGVIDDVRLSSQVQPISLQSAPPRPQVDVAWLRFDEGSGATASDETGMHAGTLAPGKTGTVPVWEPAPCRR